MDEEKCDMEENATSDDSECYFVMDCTSRNYLPEPVLLHIFQYLSAYEILTAGRTCKSWLRASYDDLLWKNLVYRHFKIDRSVEIMPGKHSWMSEYKRLTYHTPVVLTEVLTEHSHQVLHVSFAHNGKYFATCSKDGYVIVWNSNHPASIKYHKDMRAFCWKYTQFSQFNQSDTLLLVSGVHFGTPHSTSGEIAVFSLQGGFNLQCRVVNKPYDIFGTWYNDDHLLSGDLHWLAHLVSKSVLWVNKASQETSSELVPIMRRLFKFYNCNASSVRAVMVANCVASSKDYGIKDADGENSSVGQPKIFKNVRGNPPSHRDMTGFPRANSSHNGHSQASGFAPVDSAQHNWNQLGDGLEYASPIYYNQEYRQVETECRNSPAATEDSIEDPNSVSEESFFDVEAASEASEVSLEIDCNSEGDDSFEPLLEKLLIFTTGSKTYTPHQIGFKKIKPMKFPRKMDPGPTLAERIAERRRERERARERENAGDPPRPEPNWIDPVAVADHFDPIDHLIDLHGHIIGMGLSPDHRYLYVNSRPWPDGCVITNPLNPPPIAQEIDIHVIDLVTLKEVGTMLRAHKAYTPNNECFFIFLDVCNEYVASGAEDKHGYLWDRHYGVCLAKFPHSDVVNSVAFNPRDPEMLVTTSDDFSIKVWRSRNRVHQLGISTVQKQTARTLVDFF